MLLPNTDTSLEQERRTGKCKPTGLWRTVQQKLQANKLLDVLCV